MTPPATLLGAKCRWATVSVDDRSEKSNEKVIIPWLDRHLEVARAGSINWRHLVRPTETCGKALRLRVSCRCDQHTRSWCGHYPKSYVSKFHNVLPCMLLLLGISVLPPHAPVLDTGNHESVRIRFIIKEEGANFIMRRCAPWQEFAASQNEQTNRNIQR